MATGTEPLMPEGVSDCTLTTGVGITTEGAGTEAAGGGTAEGGGTFTEGGGMCGAGDGSGSWLMVGREWGLSYLLCPENTTDHPKAHWSSDPTVKVTF